MAFDWAGSFDRCAEREATRRVSACKAVLFQVIPQRARVDFETSVINFPGLAARCCRTERAGGPLRGVAFQGVNDVNPFSSFPTFSPSFLRKVPSIAQSERIAEETFTLLLDSGYVELPVYITYPLSSSSPRGRGASF